ncbi:hypothetical protein Sjap_025713 [Stephania japonica]|uniref:Uncharacterized protein n=1 Tax=Stephania japonica TaxID=461633 RepID=A0AAP0HHT2_9MAGN
MRRLGKIYIVRTYEEELEYRQLDVTFEDSRKLQLARRFWKEEDFDRSIKVLNMSEDPNDPLPICVFKDARNGSIEDCEERSRYLTKRLCKQNPLLKDEVQWNTSRIFDGGSSAPVENVPATTAQNILMPQANDQQPADEILPANASNNV